MNQATDFYNNHGSRLLRDYCYGNRRVEKAIEFALSWIPSGTCTVADIGCGIGWSSAEIVRSFKSARVLGFDLSPTLIETARRLHETPRATFSVQDVETWEPEAGVLCDAAVLLDVYEHISNSQRARLHAALAKILSDHARIILTCPTPEHQEYLRVHNPSGLQPVDESITERDVETLAQAIGGEVVTYEKVSIFRSDDYFHAVVARQARSCSRSTKRPALLSLSERRQRVRERLGVRIVSDGIAVPLRKGPRVAVASPSGFSAPSETFIRAHLQRLPFDIKGMAGGPIPTQTDEGVPLVPGGRLVMRAGSAIAKVTRQRVRFDVVGVAGYLRSANIDCVLAEYGNNAAELAPACAMAGVPLVVHFHGYEAWTHSLLERHQKSYKQMFASAAAVVATSNAMMAQLASLGCPTSKLVLSPCGVDVSQFPAGEPSSAPPVLVATGRLVEKKAPHLLLLSFERALRRFPEARLKILGDGPLRGICDQLVEGLRIGHAVEFFGAVKHQQVVAAMAGARAFVQHSVRASSGDAEGTPVAVIEAQASALPVISTRHMGIGDVVLDGVTGLLCGEGDVETMAEHMSSLLSDPSRAATLGLAGRKRVLELYSMDAHIDRLANTISAAIRTTKPRSIHFFDRLKNVRSLAHLG